MQQVFTNPTGDILGARQISVLPSTPEGGTIVCEHANIQNAMTLLRGLGGENGDKKSFPFFSGRMLMTSRIVSVLPPAVPDAYTEKHGHEAVHRIEYRGVGKMKTKSIF